MPIRLTLFRKYALIFSALIGGSLLLSGLLSINTAYQENKLSLIRLQQEKAEAAATRIAQYLFDIEQKIGTTALPRRGVSALEQRSQEIQILRSTTAINEIALLDPQGKEVLRVTRRAADVVGSFRDFSSTDYYRLVKSGRPYRSPIYFRDGSLYMSIAMAVGPEAAGITVAEVDLEFLLAGITSIKVGTTGHAYAVDTEGRLIAHPDIGLVLKNTSLAYLPQVAAAIKAPTEGRLEHVPALSNDGEPVLTAFGVIPQLGWFVFVEEPLAEAYRPLRTQAIHSALLVLIGMLFTLLACVALVRKMVQPIHTLQDGARLLGSGVLDHRIAVRTGDEFEELAVGFNRMAEQLQESYDSLERKVAERTGELKESEERFRALHDASFGGISIHDQGLILDCNQGLAELTGYTSEELIGMDGLRLIAPEWREMVVKNIQTGLEKPYEVEGLCKDGTRYQLRIRGKNIPYKGRLVRVAEFRDITERKLMEDQVRKLAYHDPLTGLPNRRLLQDRMKLSIAASKRSACYAALIFLDLDNFKPLNDKHGHEVGDLLLIEVAHRLKACVREVDTVARFGGDEFVVMLSELDPDQVESTSTAARIAEKIRVALADPYLLKIQKEGKAIMTLQHSCTASLGVAMFASTAASLEEILKSADAAMYQAKESGRNSICFAPTPSWSAAAAENVMATNL